LGDSRKRLKTSSPHGSSSEAVVARGGDEKSESKKDALLFVRLVRAADAPGASGEDIQALRDFLQTWPEVAQGMAIIGSTVQENLTKRFTSKGGSTAEMIRSGLKGMRDRLGYEDAPEIERLVIAEIVIAWLAVQSYGAQAAAAHNALAIGLWEKQINSAQKRFLRATETLAKVQKLARRAPT
jgi:hypothetical protein